MIKTSKCETSFAAKCCECGRQLINPGYHRQSVICCGKYRRWYSDYAVTVTADDGRDSLGRYHHKPQILSRDTVLIRQGGI